MTSSEPNECRPTKRYTAAGRVFGYSTPFAAFESVGSSTITRVDPYDAGTYLS